jgi:CubicO group peptidase (beta-lactamase class C family)
VIWLRANGKQDRENSKPMRTDSIFRICSMTKPIVSLGVMMLYEEGRFQLNDPVSKYIPEFGDPKVLVTPKEGKPYTIPATQPITIRHLLTHTSGLSYNWDPALGSFYKEANIASGLLPSDETIGENVKRLARLPLLFHPGERWNYGLNIDVLGYLIEVVSGQSLDQFLKQRVFEPLGMHDTFFTFLPISSTGWPRLTPGTRAKVCPGFRTEPSRKDLFLTRPITRSVVRKSCSRAVLACAPRHRIMPVSVSSC